MVKNGINVRMGRIGCFVPNCHIEIGECAEFADFFGERGDFCLP